MRRLVVTGGMLLVLVLVVLVLDVVAKGYVEARVEQEFRDSGRIQAGEVDFAIDSFPFLLRLVAFGEVSATLHIEDIQERGVTLDAFDLEVDGLVFDRVSAFRGDVRVTGIDQATASVTVSGALPQGVAGLGLQRFLPCDPAVASADEQVTLTCVTDELPPLVARVLGDTVPARRG